MNPIQAYIDFVLPNMHGWCDREKAVELANAVHRAKPFWAVEVGVFAGRSLITIALVLNPGATVIGIDPWSRDASLRGLQGEDEAWWSKLDHEEIYRECLVAVKLLGVKNARLYRETSQQAFEEGHVPPTIDFLHIDGNHSEEASCYDVAHYVPRVPSGGAVWFDDCDWKTTGKAQQLLGTLCDLERMVGNCGVYRKK